ncbi:Heparanase-like protein 1 [Apostasia shenzhenica]|uniref:Heparanase-like protein 1 n=1 Tax=Apostasia shenzhenica TaxID=1088818 RepID=A0A2I0A452_9ASPA|nr:Heparanase-like protein 1 [Apostasia shenzhenica]
MFIWSKEQNWNMYFWVIFICFLYALPNIASQQHLEATIKIRADASIAETEDNYVCATLDWWPAEKCNYDRCPWGDSSVLNLDINHPFLASAIKAFSSLRIRIGGSLQDQVVYGMPNLGHPCLPITKMADGLFGFSKGCLSLRRWDELNCLFLKTGVVVTFGLNALRGRYHIRRGIWGGSWNHTNARDFIEYTISKGYPVDSWEFGNELSGHGIGAQVDAKVYGEDLITLKAVLKDLYKKSPSKPLLLAPGGFYERQWYTNFLQASGSGVIDVITHHIYNLGRGDDPRLTKKILDPQYLSQVSEIFRDLQNTIQRHGPWASVWVGEAGGAYNGGGYLVSNTFLNSFWYLDQLGMASKFNTKTYCRQTLIGGNYGLLDTGTFIPNPDYYSALLWHRLMGRGVLSVDNNGTSFLRAYAHCAKQKTGVSVLLINLNNNTEFRITIQSEMNFKLNVESESKDDSLTHGLKKMVSWVGSKASAGSIKREEYHLTAKDGNHRSRVMLLNGRALELTEDGGIPDLLPSYVYNDAPVLVSPLSIAFVVIPNFETEACM